MTSEAFQHMDLEFARGRLGGCDDATLAEIAQILRDEAAMRLVELQEALAAKDDVSAYRAAHTLKGACANFAATSVVEAAKEIESLAKADDLDSATERLDSLKEHVSELDSELKTYLGQ